MVQERSVGAPKNLRTFQIRNQPSARELEELRGDLVKEDIPFGVFRGVAARFSNLSCLFLFLCGSIFIIVARCRVFPDELIRSPTSQTYGDVPRGFSDASLCPLDREPPFI